MKWLLATILTVTSFGCSLPGGPTYQTQPAKVNASTRPSPTTFQAAGQLPVRVILRTLGSTTRPEDADLERVIPIAPNMTIPDVQQLVERHMNWIWDESANGFYQATATHPQDQADTFGRATESPVPRSLRPMVSVEIRFRRVGAGLSDSGAQANAVLSWMRYSTPDGVHANFSQTSNRTYFEGVESTQTNVPTTINTRLAAKSVGFQADFLAARLPGNNCRFTGEVTIGAFVGSGLDTTSVSIPVQVDGPRNSWLKVATFTAGDLTASSLWKQWGSIAATADALEIELRVN